MDTADDLIRNIIISHQMEQVSQPRQNSSHFETRVAALGLNREYERVSPRIDYSSNLAPKISSVVDQQNRQQPDLHVANTEIMDRLEMMQNERIISSFRDYHHSISSGNTLMNPPLYSRIHCRICGRSPFSSYLELLVHENSCSVNSIGDTMIRQQYVSNNETSDTDQRTRYRIDQDTISDIHMPIAEGIVRSTYAPSSLRASSFTSTMSSENSQEGASSLQSSNSLSLATTDKEWFSPVQHFVYRNCVEFFVVPASDTCLYSSKAKGRYIHAGQIGIRCPYCCTINEKKETGTKSSIRVNTCSAQFPTSIASIYSVTLDLLQHHTRVCDCVPQEILKQYNELNTDYASGTKSRQYWIESAKALGLVDTTSGVQFSSYNSLVISNKSCMLPPVTSLDSYPMTQDTEALPLIIDDKRALFQDIEGGPLVDLKYKHLATSYAYALLSQVQACTFMESDRHNKWRRHSIGFPGLACRHCSNGKGCGRFFPSSIKTMSDTSKTQDVLHNHMLRCQQCPLRVKVGLQTLRLRHDEERSNLRFGSQRAFYVCIWTRLHGDTPFDSAKVSYRKKRSP